MSILTNACTGSDPKAIAALLAPLKANPPNFLAAYCSSEFRCDDVMRQLGEVGTSALHGATSCLGVMTNDGMLGRDGDGFGYLALWDETGAFGTATLALGDDPQGSAEDATRSALKRAQRPGEAPSLIWVSSAPGSEELVIAGIEAAVGPNVPILGGSAADNSVSGNWAVFGHDGIYQSGITVSVLFTTQPATAAFHSGYAPEGGTAKVTKSSGRRVYTLDDHPAADVYSRATGLSFDVSDKPQSILSETSFHPMGRALVDVAGIPFQLLLHPAVLHPDRSIEFFADVEDGLELHFMSGSPDSLTNRAGRVASQAKREAEFQGNTPHGALVIFCAGCMMSITDRMGDVVAGIDQALGGAPFLGVFTFGEQGFAINEKNCHGNLMISCVSFSS